MQAASRQLADGDRQGLERDGECIRQFLPACIETLPGLVGRRGLDPGTAGRHLVEPDVPAAGLERMGDPLDLVAVLLRDAHGGDKRKAADDLLMMVVGLFGAYADWVSSDAFNEAFRRDGPDLDALWRQFSKDAVSIKPPSDPEQIQMQIPDWLLMKSAEFARTYWTDQSQPNSERKR